MNVPFNENYRRIATEEAYLPPEVMQLYLEMLARGDSGDPGFDSLWGFYGNNDSARARAIHERIQDLDALRLQDMDEAGIDLQLIAITAPGVQVLDAGTAKTMSVLTNDRMAEAVRRHPTRFAALATCAPQAPEHAAREIERAVTQLGFKGVMINSHTQHEYLNDPKFWPIFEACEALDVPLYLHPNTPSRGLIQPMLERGLEGAVFGFAVETGMHALSIITSGAFDRFPGLKLVLGHLGEGLPFWLFRLDYMHGAGQRAKRYDFLPTLRRPVSEYLRQNVWVTTSGMPWAPSVRFCQDVLGMDRVLYAMDYPYQYVPDEVRAMDALAISDDDKRRFFQTNAETLFKL